MKLVLNIILFNEIKMKMLFQMVGSHTQSTTDRRALKRSWKTQLACAKNTWAEIQTRLASLSWLWPQTSKFIQCDHSMKHAFSFFYEIIYSSLPYLYIFITYWVFIFFIDVFHWLTFSNQIYIKSMYCKSILFVIFCSFLSITF